MSWETWVPAISASGIVAVAGLIGGYFLKAFVEKGVQHGFNRQIELLKSEIRAKADDINSLRSGALANMTARHGELDKRRIQAAEVLWNATTDLHRFQMITSFVTVMNIPMIDEILKNGGEEGRKMKLFAEDVWRASGMEALMQSPHRRADTERLFVPPKAWLAYEALTSATTRAIAIAVMLKSGVGTSLLKKNDSTIELIKKVLPHRSQYLDQYSDVAPYYLQNELEEYLFVELTAAFSSSEHYRKSIEDASGILKHAAVITAPDLPVSIPDALKIDPPAIFP